MKKSSQVQTILKDPDTGKDVTTPEEIKRVSLNNIKNLLTKKPIDEEFSDEIRKKKSIHFERMEEKVEDYLDDLPFSTFQKTLDSLTKKPGSKYDYITKSGYSLQMALFNLFQIVWRRKKIPKKSSSQKAKHFSLT